MPYNIGIQSKRVWGPNFQGHVSFKAQKKCAALPAIEQCYRSKERVLHCSDCLDACIRRHAHGALENRNQLRELAQLMKQFHLSKKS